MFLSREIYIKLYLIYTKIFIYKTLYKNSRLHKSYSANNNLKTTISQRSLRNLGSLLLIFEFNNFSFMILFIYPYILFICPYYVTRTPTNMAVQYTLYRSHKTDSHVIIFPLQSPYRHQKMLFHKNTVLSFLKLYGVKVCFVITMLSSEKKVPKS